MSSDDSPRFMKSTGRSVTASRGGNISRRTLRLSRVRSETPCSSLRRCADKKAALLVRRAAQPVDKVPIVSAKALAMGS